MNVNQIDNWYGEQGQCYAIPVTEKGNRQRYVYIKGAATYYLSRCLKERPSTRSNALFLSHSNERLTRSALSSLMWRLKQDAGIPAHEPASAHAFRHAFAIRQLDEGYDLAVVSQWLGHSNPEFTAKVYCVRSEQELRRRFFADPKKAG